jgi:hypothetical protein
VRDASAFKRSFGTSTAAADWQNQAWTYVKQVGELDYYVRWRASSVSRCRLIASELDDRGMPTGGVDLNATGEPTEEGVRVQDIINGIGGSGLGAAKLLRRVAYVLSVPGECWIAMLVRNPAREQSAISATPDAAAVRSDEPEQWFVFDRSEIRAGATDVTLLLPDGMSHTFDPSRDLMFRVWDEDPRTAWLPTSPVYTNREALNEIVRATAAIDNASKSRLIGNGIIFVPQEISLPQQAMPVPTPPGGADPDAPAPLMVGMHASAQEFQDLLYDVATAAMKDPDSVAATLPLIASAPGDQIKNVQWVRAASDVPTTALTTRDSAVRRLAMGLDVSPERLLGVGGNSNHWSAWQIEETDVKVHIVPVVEMIVSALTEQVLRPALIEERIDPDKYVIWYDSTDLTQDPDKRDAAQTAYDRGALSSASLRDYLGLEVDDGYDLESTDGWLQMMLDRIANNPAVNLPIFEPILRQLLTGKLAELIPEQAAAPAIGVAGGDPGAAQPGDAPSPQQEPAAGPPMGDKGEKAAPQVSAAGMTVARLCVNRALELAAKRRRTRSNAAEFRGVPIELAHTVLGPVEMDQVTDLIKGWNTGMTDSDLVDIGLEPGRFRSVVHGVSAIALVTASPPVITGSMLASMPNL